MKRIYEIESSGETRMYQVLGQGRVRSQADEYASRLHELVVYRRSVPVLIQQLSH